MKESKDQAASHKSEECLPRDQAERLFQHAMHEDTIFNARMHNFLIIQSVLLGVIALRQSATVAPHTPRIIAVVSLALTFAWLYVQGRQKRKLDILIARLEKALPEFSRTRALTRPLPCRPTSTALLAYLVPSVFVIIWVWVLVIVWSL